MRRASELWVSFVQIWHWLDGSAARGGSSGGQPDLQRPAACPFTSKDFHHGAKCWDFSGASVAPSSPQVSFTMRRTLFSSPPSFPLCYSLSPVPVLFLGPPTPHLRPHEVVIRRAHAVSGLDPRPKRLGSLTVEQRKFVLNWIALFIHFQILIKVVLTIP